MTRRYKRAENNLLADEKGHQHLGQAGSLLNYIKSLLIHLMCKW